MPPHAVPSYTSVRTEMNNCRNVRSPLRGNHISEPAKLICPKPQKVSTFSPMVPSVRLWRRMPQVACDGGEAGHEILEIFMRKTDTMESIIYGDNNPPPTYIGSPPPRSGNPLVRDSLFLQAIAKPAVNCPTPKPVKLSPLRPNSPSVRIEGFDCTGHDTARRQVALIA